MRNILPINLQLFAQDDAPNTDNLQNGQNDVKGQNTSEENNEPKTYTQKDIEDIKKQQEKEYNKKFEQEVKKRLEEEKRLSTLSKEEREKEDRENKIKELEEREKNLIVKEKISDIKDELIKRKLPVIFASYLVEDTNEKSLYKINEFEKIFVSAVEEKVNSKIQGVNLKAGNSNKNSLGQDMAKKLNEMNKTKSNLWN